MELTKTKQGSLQMQSLERKSITRLRDSIESGNQLSKLFRQDPVSAIHSVSVLIKRLMNWIKTKRTIETDEELLDLAQMIIEEYYFLTIEEVSFAFRQAVLGKRGQVYDRLDPATVLGYLSSYQNQERKSYLKRKQLAEQRATIERDIQDIKRGYQRLMNSKEINRVGKPLRNCLQDLPGYEAFKMNYEKNKKKEVA